MPRARLWSRLSAEEKANVVSRLRAMIDDKGARIKWKAAARELGISNIDAARGVIDPEWYDRRNNRVRDRRAGLVKTTRLKGDGTPAHMANRCAPPAEDIAARLAEIPPDTRSLTARLFGDPIPGRRAIDQRRAT
jgi:hypothetical protein